MQSRRSILAAVTALIVAPALAACSFSAGQLEPVGGDSEASESAPAESAPADAGAEVQTVTAEHLTAQIPADWQSVGDSDGWSYVYVLQQDDADGGVDGRIGFMPGGQAMSAQESIDWFIGQVEGTGATDENFAPVTTLRTGEDRANTSYTYQSDGQQYTGVVWSIIDGNGIPSLIQLSGSADVMTPEFVAQVDQSLDVTGNWEGSAS
ncbi:hypothetical protein C8K30_102517 [Promicromonospora sp. AC04]|nr:hypothetical protein C8K30_102517 [Promicromonospora sp. AC04]